MVFIPLTMERAEKKRVELRPVDDEVAPVVEVVRLENSETGPKPRYEEPVRLGGGDASQPPSRLDLPSQQEVELRTHQPGIDELIDPNLVGLESTEERWGSDSRHHPMPWGWFVLIGLVITGAVAWSLIHLKESDVQVVQIRENTESVLDKEAREEREARELVERIEAALRGFFAAGTVDSLARWVRQPERVLPLMREYYSRHPLQVTPVEPVGALQPVTLDGRANFWIASVMLTDGRKSKLIIEIDAAGNPLIDWETKVCYQPMPWDDFARERPAGKSMDFRVYVERDSLFSHEFADADRWLCFRLTALGGEELMFGYVLADSNEARAILDAFQKNSGGPVSLILRLGIPEGLQSRQGVVIEKMLSKRWLYVDPPESAP